MVETSGYALKLPVHGQAHRLWARTGDCAGSSWVRARLCSFDAPESVVEVQFLGARGSAGTLLLPERLWRRRGPVVPQAEKERSRAMKIVIFGLAVSSSWGNGHATLWRGLIAALDRLGHGVVFFERDTPYYAETRDLDRLPGRAGLVLYPDWESVRTRARAEAARADAAIVTSFCPDGPAAAELVAEATPGPTVFYDMDTPVTLARLAAGERVAYLPRHGLGDFDLVLSYTGGVALQLLRDRLGARRVGTLYGHVDPAAHRLGTPREPFRADLSYLGTFADDRQEVLARLFLDTARAMPDRRFVLAGSGYPEAFPWHDNIYFVRHLPPSDHPDFFASSRVSLNVTRGDMAEMGWCPSGRLFEAAACGVPMLSDRWEGLEDFFEPGREILTAATTREAVEALALSDGALAEIARAARARVMEEHTSEARASELVKLLHDAGAVAAAGSPRRAAACGA
jgi:spore maturation protein CgeB